MKYGDPIDYCNMGIMPNESGGLVYMYDRNGCKDRRAWKIPPQVPFVALCKEKQVEVVFKVEAPQHYGNPNHIVTDASFIVEDDELKIEETIFDNNEEKDLLVLFLNVKDCRFQIQIRGHIGTHALVGYLKQMSRLCKQMDKLVESFAL